MLFRSFGERRLRPQAELLARRGWSVAGLEELLQRLPDLLEGHAPEPCLVHGDLWSGNAMARLRPAPAAPSLGGGAIFDPAVHRADREVDLAMAHLFGGFPAAFFEGYGSVWPLPDGHGERRPIYNLYHLLNHAVLFGEPYIGQAARTLEGILAAP